MDNDYLFMAKDNPDDRVAAQGRILLVDDDTDLLESLKDLLEDEGFRVETATGPDDARRLVGSFCPDAALLDVKLGAADGLDLVPELKHRIPGLVCIVMTAFAEAESAIKAVRHGADDYLHKPVAPDLLLRTLDRCLRQQRLAREREAAIAALRESERKYRTIVDSTSDGYWLVDTDLKTVEVNAALRRMLDYDSEALIGRSPLDFAAENDRATLRGLFDRVATTGHAVHEIALTRRDGGLVESRFNLTRIDDPSGAPAGAFAFVADITEQRRFQRRIAHMAEHDALTGLPNRLLLMDRLGQAIATARRHGEKLAVAFFDLDRFKLVNDTFGHAVGDKLLIDIAGRLRECLRETDTVARLGGDEFVALLAGIKTPADVSAVTDKIADRLAEPMVIDGHEFLASCSVGISLFPQDGDDAETLLKNADAAMYSGKAEGTQRPRFFTSRLNEIAAERLDLERDMRRALDNAQFTLAYQPKVDLKTGRLTGVEALLRWRHPSRGQIPPAKFIPLAEETGLIVPIGEWVIRTCCEQIRAWQDAGLAGLPVAVNLSERQLRQPSLVPDVARILDETGVSGESLVIELTESLVMSDIDANLRALHRFKDMGLSIAVDDFGTGHSSLSYLKRLPIDSLKIDREFIKDLCDDHDDRAIVDAIVSLSHSLHLTVIAEGVEKEPQAEFLRQIGCDEMQGFLYSRPLPAPALERFIRDRQTS